MINGPVHDHCASCGEVMAGPFCSSCGETVVNEASMTLRGFFLNGFHTLTDYEHGLWPSLKLLVTKPGFLTKAYLKGQRVGYMRPMRLFLLINVLYFVTQPMLLGNTYNTKLKGHMTRQIYREHVRELVEATVAERGVDLEVYTESFDKTSLTLARSLIMVLVPFFALGTGIMFRRRGVPAVGSLIFALHFIAYYLLIGSIGLGTFILASIKAIEAAGGDPSSYFNELTLTSAMLLLTIVYLQPAIRRVYGLGMWLATLSAFTLGVLFFPMIFFYRYLLFWATWLLV